MLIHRVVISRGQSRVGFCQQGNHTLWGFTEQVFIEKLSHTGDNLPMTYQIKTTPIFDKWIGRLKDAKTKARIILRLKQVSMGNFGDHKQVSQNLYELRCFFASGIRIYYTRKGSEIVVLLCGGDKSTQSKDIEKAKRLLAKLGD